MIFPRSGVLIVMGVTLLFSGACEVGRRKSDVELALNPQQASGRHIYDQYCDRCHEAYSSHKRKGPSLQGVFKREDYSERGMPANDQRTRELIVCGSDTQPSDIDEPTQH